MMILYGIGISVMFAITTGCTGEGAEGVPHGRATLQKILADKKLHTFLGQGVELLGNYLTDEGARFAEEELPQPSGSREGQTVKEMTVDIDGNTCKITVTTDENNIITNIKRSLC
jgi:hypothetical protein